MDRRRSAEPESDTAVPAPARVPARSAEPGGEVAARLLGYQATGGNQMVLRLLAAARQADAGPSIAENIQGRLGGGSPLPADVRADAEAGFGRPLGDVRLHTDAPAAALATQLNAHAFTTGNDVFFNSGVYDPGSRGGYEVLVHELTHTVQQSSGPVSGRLAAEGLSVSEVHDPDEREARAVAARLTAQRGTHVGPSQASNAQRSGAGDGGSLTVQRHSSWEHTLLGNTPPDRLGEATVEVKARKHLLGELARQMALMIKEPETDPRLWFPDLRWLQLAGSSLWVSNGELNALADYLPDPAAADTMSSPQLVPILQKMRTEIWNSAAKDPFLKLSSPPARDMATHWTEFVTQEGGQVMALDEATAALGTNRYAGLLARNACHFAPFSWDRWEQFHNEAAEEARAHFASRSEQRPLKDVPKETEEHARQALLKNGYGDHFLQDSFAAGHLVNKTLIMQWWVDYLYDKIPEEALQHPPAGQPGLDMLERMRSQVQPGVAGRELYQHKPSKETNRDDRKSGKGVTDPQTAQERTDQDRRRSGSGVIGADEDALKANYQAYLRLLNSSVAQGSTKAVHDHFNAIGLTVVAGNGTRMKVGGDETLLAESDKVGAQMAATAAQLSRQAIDDLLNTGKTTITTEQIFGYVPVAVVPDGATGPVPLEQWHNTILRKLCFETIFPAFYLEWKTTVLDISSEVVKGGVSRDTAPAR